MGCCAAIVAWPEAIPPSTSWDQDAATALPVCPLGRDAADVFGHRRASTRHFTRELARLSFRIARLAGLGVPDADVAGNGRGQDGGRVNRVVDRVDHCPRARGWACRGSLVFRQAGLGDVRRQLKQAKIDERGCWMHDRRRRRSLSKRDIHSKAKARQVAHLLT